MLGSEYDEKTLALFRDARDACYLAHADDLPYFGSSAEVSAKEAAAYEALKQQIMDAGLWFEFLYYCREGHLNVRSDIALGDGLIWNPERGMFYCLAGAERVHLDEDAVYAQLSEDGARTATEVGKTLDRMAMPIEECEAIKQALHIYERADADA